jgi:hypothetical protein
LFQVVYRDRFGQDDRSLGGKFRRLERSMSRSKVNVPIPMNHRSDQFGGIKLVNEPSSQKLCRTIQAPRRSEPHFSLLGMSTNPPDLVGKRIERFICFGHHDFYLRITAPRL